ncbi:hypothetical protein WJX81_001610 [Elliptochloris bilobata]|uniref:Transmembrane protein n=1 Tax=Elliptochloris bilobata TaxID=381761 RepID=A0AAW1R289_9CHLO
MLLTEYYHHASRKYRSQFVWVKRCCLGVAVCTAFVLCTSLLSTPSSGVRSSRLVNFNGTETEYSPGVFDRLTGHFQRARDTLWSWGGFWDDLDADDEYWEEEDGEPAEEPELWDEVTGEENDAAYAVTDTRADAAEEMARERAEKVGQRAGKPAEGKLAAAKPMGSKPAGSKPAGSKAAGGKPAGGKPDPAEKAAEDALEEAEEERAEMEAEAVGLELPSRLGKHAAPAGISADEDIPADVKDSELADLQAGKPDAAAEALPQLEEEALEKEEVAEEKEAVAEAAWEKKEELEVKMEAAEDAGDTTAQELEPLVEAAEAEYEKKEADADAALKAAEKAEEAATQAAKEKPAGFWGRL